MSLTYEQKLARGWFYIGKIKYYNRECSNCGEGYTGQGRHFCSKKCASDLSIAGHNDGTYSIIKRERSTGHNYSEAISKGKKGKPAHPNSIKSSILAKKGKPLLKETIARVREALPKKEAHWNWKGGITPIKKSLRCSPEWRYWRKEVFTRDEYKCVECESSVQLEPHHIIPLRVCMETIFDVNNGITLCRGCHQNTFRREEDFIERYNSMVSKSQQS